MREFKKTFQQAGPIPVYRAALASAYARTGEVKRAREMLRQLEDGARTRPVSQVEIAAVHVALGDRELALPAWSGLPGSG